MKKVIISLLLVGVLFVQYTVKGDGEVCHFHNLTITNKSNKPVKFHLFNTQTDETSCIMINNERDFNLTIPSQQSKKLKVEEVSSEGGMHSPGYLDIKTLDHHGSIEFIPDLLNGEYFFDLNSHYINNRDNKDLICKIIKSKDSTENFKNINLIYS